MWLAHEWQLLFTLNEETYFHNDFVGHREGRILKLYKMCHTVSQSFLWKPHFYSIHILKQVSIHGILFFSIENCLCRRPICNIWQWKSRSWMHGNVYLQHIPFSETDMLYDSSLHSVLESLHFSVLSIKTCKKNQLFSSEAMLCSDWKEIVEELMVLK